MKFFQWIGIAIVALVVLSVVIGIVVGAQSSLNDFNAPESLTVEDQGQVPDQQAPPRRFRFAGNGSKALPPIHVPTGETLHWTNQDDSGYRLFVLYDDNGGVYVSSKAGSGSTYVPPGTYQIHVMGGSWKFEIR